MIEILKAGGQVSLTKIKELAIQQDADNRKGPFHVQKYHRNTHIQERRQEISRKLQTYQFAVVHL